MFVVPSFFGFQFAGGFDPDYQAIIDYATIQGYTLPSSSQQALQNELMIDLKAAGIWSKLDTFAVFATDGNSDFALIDWKRLTQYTAVNSPTFTTNVGFAGNGTSSYIDTNFDLLLSKVNMSQDSATYAVFLNTTGGQYAIGTSLAYTRVSSLTQTAVRINSTANFAPGRNNAVGYNCYVRNGANTVQVGIPNGTFTASITNASTVILNQSTYLLRAQTLYSNASVGSCFIANAFNLTEWSNLVTIYNNYKNSL